MNDIDELATTLLEESKRFLDKAKESQETAQHAYLHASLSLGFSALEAHVNSVVDEQLKRTDLGVHERAFMAERKVDLKRGEFVQQPTLQMQRIDDRISFLWTRCSTVVPYDYQASAWSNLQEGLKMRNALTHPREHTELTVLQVDRSLSAIIEIIDSLFQRIYGKSLPAKARGLQSKLNF